MSVDIRALVSSTESGFLDWYIDKHPDEVRADILHGAELAAAYFNGELSPLDYLLALGVIFHTKLSAEELKSRADEDAKPFLPYLIDNGVREEERAEAAEEDQGSGEGEVQREDGEAAEASGAVEEDAGSGLAGESSGSTDEGSVEATSEGEPVPVGTGPFGNIYNQFRGKAQTAIAFLMKKQSGEALGALHHKDIGDYYCPLKLFSVFIN